MDNPPPPRPERAPGEPPGLVERVGCFGFVAFPLVFGIPVAQAWAGVLGGWFLYAYGAAVLGTLGFIIFVLERADEEGDSDG